MNNQRSHSRGMYRFWSMKPEVYDFIKTTLSTAEITAYRYITEGNYMRATNTGQSFRWNLFFQSVKKCANSGERKSRYQRWWRIKQGNHWSKTIHKTVGRRDGAWCTDCFYGCGLSGIRLDNWNKLCIQRIYSNHQPMIGGNDYILINITRN